jgi:penicillin-binding protein 2
MDRFLANKKVKTSFKEEIEPHEVLLDFLAEEKEKEMGISRKKLEVPLARGKTWLFCFLFFACLGFFFIRAFQLGVLGHTKYIFLAEANKNRDYLLRPLRGVIYDSKGSQLVFNQPVFDLVLNKKEFLALSSKKQEEIVETVSGIIALKKEDIVKKTNESKEDRVLLKENLAKENLAFFEPKIATGELVSLSLEKNFIRRYEDGEIFSQFIGYIARINEEEYQQKTGYA